MCCISTTSGVWSSESKKSKRATCAIRSDPKQSEAIGSEQKQAEAIRGNQKQSEAIREQEVEEGHL